MVSSIDFIRSGGEPTTPVTHGDQISASNTGYTAYYDTTLRRTLQLADLQVISVVHWISDFVSSGGTIYTKRFTGTIIIDIDDVTIRGCLFDSPVSGYLNGNNASGWTLDFCTINPTSIADECVRFGGYTAHRCQLINCSDGAKVSRINELERSPLPHDRRLSEGVPRSPVTELIWDGLISTALPSVRTGALIWMKRIFGWAASREASVVW